MLVGVAELFAQDDVDAHGRKVFGERVEGVPDFLMAVDSCLSHDGKMFNFSVEGNHTITPRKPHDNYSAENVCFFLASRRLRRIGF